MVYVGVEVVLEMCKTMIILVFIRQYIERIIKNESTIGASLLFCVLCENKEIVNMLQVTNQ